MITGLKLYLKCIECAEMYKKCNEIMLINYNRVCLSLVLPDVGKVPEVDLGPKVVENGHYEV